MTRSLLISLPILFVSCTTAYQSLGPATSSPESCAGKFKPPFSAELYNTQVDVIGKHLSGLLFFKKLTGTSLHIVFMSEAGITYFDFEFADSGFVVHRILPALNKKQVVRTLKRDFDLITMNFVGREKPVTYTSGEYSYHAYKYVGTPSKKETDYVVTDKNCSTLQRLETGARKKKTEVLFFGESGAVPDSIHVQHFNFDMNISLRKLDRKP